MQTFQRRLAERWLGSLKPMVLSNCSYLRGDRDTPLQVDPALKDMMGWDLPCQGPQVPLAGAVTMQKSCLQSSAGKVRAQSLWVVGSCPHTFGLSTLLNCKWLFSAR